MDLNCKTYKVFLLSNLPKEVKDSFIDYNTDKVKNIGLFFTTGKQVGNGVEINGEILTEKEPLYPVYAYFKELENEIILIYYNEI